MRSERTKELGRETAGVSSLIGTFCAKVVVNQRHFACQHREIGRNYLHNPRYRQFLPIKRNLLTLTGDGLPEASVISL
jgi:hypothetical protein